MDSGLLAQIQKGKSLKKAQTNDRSAPMVAGGPTKSSGPSSGMARPPPTLPGGRNPTATSNVAASAPQPPSAPQLGGLFTQGMPTLRKTRGPAVSTGRGTATDAPSPAPQVPSVVRPPTANKPFSGSSTLPRSFKAPPPIPGRGTPPIPSSAPQPSPSVGINASIPPPPPPPPPGNSSYIPPPPPPPPVSGVPSVPGVSPNHASTLASTGGRSRSNSSPQRPIPPPPPRGVPSPPTTSSRQVPVFPNRFTPQLPSNQSPGLAVPPPLPPGRARSSSATQQDASIPTPPPAPSVNKSPSARPSAPSLPPPQLPSTIGRSATTTVTPPRSPLPPLPGRQSMRPPQPPQPPSPLSSPQLAKQPSLTEGNGRFKFRSISALPSPRHYQPTSHVYQSGESRGNAYPLNINTLGR